jgi:hypothetical protein
MSVVSAIFADANRPEAQLPILAAFSFFEWRW